MTNTPKKMVKSKSSKCEKTISKKRGTSMPRKKKKPDYVDFPQDANKLVVQKSNPLQSLSETGLTLPQFKILDAYLSRIDSHDEDKRFVRFGKGQLEKILGVTRILKEELQKRLDNLFQKVTIRDKDKKNGFTTIALFEKAEAYQDDNGLWQVELACTPSAIEYIFNVENIGYLRYRLRNVMNLTSRYSYVLYLFLEKHLQSKTKVLKISIEKLKIMLNCTAESYRQYKRFNDLILKKCQKEINEKTNLTFSYYPDDRVARSYTTIVFAVTEKQISPAIESYDKFNTEQVLNVCCEDDSLQDENLDVEEADCVEEVNYGSDLADLLGEAACRNEFSLEQIRIIQDLVIKVPACKEGLIIDEIKCCNYLRHKMNLLDYYKVKNRFAYLLKMINQDIAHPEDMI